MCNSQTIKVINSINGTSDFHIKTNIFDKLEQNLKMWVTTHAQHHGMIHIEMSDLLCMVPMIGLLQACGDFYIHFSFIAMHTFTWLLVFKSLVSIESKCSCVRREIQKDNLYCHLPTKIIVKRQNINNITNKNRSLKNHKWNVTQWYTSNKTNSVILHYTCMFMFAFCNTTLFQSHSKLDGATTRLCFEQRC